MGFAAIHVANFMVQAVVRGEAQPRERAIALVDGTPPLVNVVAADEALCGLGFNWG